MQLDFLIVLYMPRNRRRNNYYEDEYGQEPLGPPIQIIQPTQPPTIIVENYLKNNYWEMCEKLEKSLECSICLEHINCKNCFTLLVCGHSYHLCCITRCRPNQCPLCRSGEPNQH